MDTIQVNMYFGGARVVYNVCAEITAEGKESFNLDYLLLDAFYMTYQTYQSEQGHTFNITESWLNESVIEGKCINLLKQIGRSTLLEDNIVVNFTIKLHKYDTNIVRENQIINRLYTGLFNLADEVFYGKDLDIPVLNHLSINYIDPVEKSVTFDKDSFPNAMTVALTFTDAEDITIYQNCNLKSISFVNSIGRLYADACVLSKDEFYANKPFFRGFLISDYHLSEAARLQRGGCTEEYYSEVIHTAAIYTGYLLQNIKSFLKELKAESSFLTTAMISDEVKSSVYHSQLLQEISAVLNVDSSSEVVQIYTDLGVCRFLYEGIYRETGPSSMLTLEKSDKVYEYQFPISYLLFNNDPEFLTMSLKELIRYKLSPQVTTFTDNKSR